MPNQAGENADRGQVRPWQGTGPVRHLLRIACVAAVAAAWIGCPRPALAETATPTAAAQIAHAEFLPYMDPPPGPPAAVCLVDTGVDLNPDTQPLIESRVALDGGDPGDVWDRKHGTEMAMMMGAPVNGWGTVGAWPYVRIVSVRAMPPGGSGFPFSYYAKSILKCRQIPGVRVINLSLSGPPPAGDDLTEFDDIASGTRRRGVAIVAGAGNSGGGVEYPAADENVFAVAASGVDHALCDFSARGPEVAVRAPGCGIVSANSASGDEFAYAGTSPAAAFTSAVLGALLSYRPDAPASQAEDFLRQTSRGGGLDVEAAFRRAGLGREVDMAASRVPAVAAPSDADIASPSPQVPDVATDPGISVQVPGGGYRWRAPRVATRRCTRGRLHVRVSNRPALARVVLRGYNRRGEFGSKRVVGVSSRQSSLRVATPFDYATIWYERGRRGFSPTVTVHGCANQHS